MQITQYNPPTDFILRGIECMEIIFYWNKFKVDIDVIKKQLEWKHLVSTYILTHLILSNSEDEQNEKGYNSQVYYLQFQK